jgi:hypothetical protein
MDATCANDAPFNLWIKIALGLTLLKIAKWLCLHSRYLLKMTTPILLRRKEQSEAGMAKKPGKEQGGIKAPPLTPKFNKAAQGNSPDGLQSIRNHPPKQSYEMKGPGGAAIRKQEANKTYSKDQAEYNKSRASKYAKMDKEPDKSPDKSKSLTQTFNKSSGKGQGLG